LISPGHVQGGDGWSDVGLYAWDGVEWTRLDPYPTGILDIGVYQDHLAACGTFPFGSDGTTVRALAVLEDDGWVPIQGAPRDVYALAAWRDQLYMGGRFLSAGGRLSRNVACWDGRGVLEGPPEHSSPLTVGATGLGASGIRLVFSLLEPVAVDLGIFDLQGRRVATLVEGLEGRGERVHVWNGLDHEGRRVPSGIYFARLKAGAQRGTAKIPVIH
jgi:hypothetical protein